MALCYSPLVVRYRHSQLDFGLWSLEELLVASVSVYSRTPFSARDQPDAYPPSRTIVPIYQSEISPPNHVFFSFVFPPTQTEGRISQRGALACMEFTGNIIGYSSSVVRPTHSCVFSRNSSNFCLVDRLLLLFHWIWSFLANTPFCPMRDWIYPCSGHLCAARESQVAHRQG